MARPLLLLLAGGLVSDTAGFAPSSCKRAGRLIKSRAGVHEDVLAPTAEPTPLFDSPELREHIRASVVEHLIDIEWEDEPDHDHDAIYAAFQGAHVPSPVELRSAPKTMVDHDAIYAAFQGAHMPSPVELRSEPKTVVDHDAIYAAFQVSHVPSHEVTRPQAPVTSPDHDAFYTAFQGAHVPSHDVNRPQSSAVDDAFFESFTSAPPSFSNYPEIGPQVLFGGFRRRTGREAAAAAAAVLSRELTTTTMVEDDHDARDAAFQSAHIPSC